MRWALALLATDSLHRVSSTTSFKSAWIEISTTAQKIKSKKQGEEGSPIREAKEHPLFPCTFLCPKPPPHSLSSVRDAGRAQPGRSRAAPHACDVSGASPQPCTVPAAFIFLISNLWFQHPCLGLNGGRSRVRVRGSPRLREQRSVPGQPRSRSAPAGQVPRRPSDRTGGEKPLLRKKKSLKK